VPAVRGVSVCCVELLTSKGLGEKDGKTIKPDLEVNVAKRPPSLLEPRRAIELVTNHFRFEMKDQIIYQHSVEFSVSHFRAGVD
jgi:hypothetical protein